jgi:hypothetical protein
MLLQSCLHNLSLVAMSAYWGNRATTGWNNYSSSVLGNRYSLSVNGAIALQGNLQNDTSFNSGAAGLPYNPARVTKCNERLAYQGF